MDETVTASNDDKRVLTALCSDIKREIAGKRYDHAECALRIAKAMEQYPDAPEPHNLLGILLEESGDHRGAMKHFRAAWALDPGYRPAHFNMESLGGFFPEDFSVKKYAFDDSDCGPREDAASPQKSKGMTGKFFRKEDGRA